MTIETSIGLGTGQPYPYQRVELVEPDWTRFPGWKDVTAAEWDSVQWQRAHCVKNLQQLRELLGDLVDERFYADLERDQAERATMSMLVPPQMMNTMAPHDVPAGPGSLTEAFYADPVRHYMLPVFSDRRTDWPSHPHATRDSLHEHDMWATEGLTHRYPTKVLAELLPTCPQYCGHCTRMDLVGNSTAVIDKLKFVGKPNDRLGDMLDYLRRTPGVRDVVVSGGDVANMPWPRLESFLTDLLEIENIRDIRLATKALMGAAAALAAARGRRGHDPDRHDRPAARGLRRDPHPRQPRQLGHAAGGEGDPGDARHRHPRRPQPGRAPQRRQRRPARAARPVLPAARWRADHALLLLHVRHDPVLGALAGLGRRRPAAAAPRSWATCRASRRRGSCATCRSSASGGCTSSPSYDIERGISHWTKNYRTSIEAADPEALTRTYEYYDPIHTLPAEGQAWWAEHAVARRVRAPGRRDGRGVAPYGGAAGVLNPGASASGPSEALRRTWRRRSRRHPPVTGRFS